MDTLFLPWSPSAGDRQDVTCPGINEQGWHQILGWLGLEKL